MRASQYAMKTIYDSEYCSLHVRVGNRAAIALYKDVLGFEIRNVDEKYYADGEDAYDMRLTFKKPTITVEEEKKSTTASTKETEENKKEADALKKGDKGKEGV